MPPVPPSLPMKRHVFEEMLQTELRWPTAGDMPFVTAEDRRENANIAEDEFTRFVLMMEGYKKAADLMVAQAAANRFDRDYLVCPIIFNYRQFLELSIKYLIATYGRTVGIKPVWKSHDLVSLWKLYGEMLELYGTPDPDVADPIVAGIVAEFAKIDPGSYSYRYPVDTNGRPIPITYGDLHLPTLADVMNGVAGYFTGSDGYLSELQSAAP
jgi:hypothetical protein